MTENLNPDRIVFCRLLLSQWMKSLRMTMQVGPDLLLSMALAMEEVSMELRQEAAENATEN